MFGRSPNIATTLRIGEEEYQFTSPRDFEFALAGRTSLPPDKVAILVDAPDEALLREAEGIRRIEQRLEDALSGVLEEATSISGFMLELDMSVVTQDHDWRAIMSALNDSGAHTEEYKRVALVKYIQYLNARQQVIRSIYGLRHRSMRSDQRNGGGTSHDSPMRETVIFDVSSFVRGGGEELTRMPKGEQVEINLESDRPLNILLAKHPFTLVACDDGIRFSGKGAQSGLLRPGRNVIGRDANADVVIDHELRDVSRRHLLVETDGRTHVRLTDMSSHGTSIPPAHLDRTNA